MSLKYAILGFLSFKPLSGYDLKKAFDYSVSHFWPANQSQIYRTLAELDEEKLVEKEVIEREDRLDMKVYNITEAGRAALQTWLSTPLPEQAMREPFLIQIYFSGQLSDEAVIGLLQREIDQAEERIQVYLTIYESVYRQPSGMDDPRALYLCMLTLEYGLAANRALIAWARRALERIQAGNYAPADLSIYQVER